MEEDTSETVKIEESKMETSDTSNGNTNGAESAPVNEEKQDEIIKGEEVTFKMVWNKTNYDITLGLENSVLELRKHIEELTGLYCRKYLLSLDNA